MNDAIMIIVMQCCDRKARAASAQSFTLWQQETIEITRCDHSIIACSRHIKEASVNPDLRQYRIKSALFTSRNPDFSPLTRGCVLKVH